MGIGKTNFLSDAVRYVTSSEAYQVVSEKVVCVAEKVQKIATQVFSFVEAVRHTLFNMIIHPMNFMEGASEQYPERSWIDFIPKWIGGIACQLKDEVKGHYECEKMHHSFVNLGRVYFS